jgi:hypothetical protein
MKGSLLHYVDNILFSGCGSAIFSPKLMSAMEAADTPEDALKAFCDGWTHVFSCNKVSSSNFKWFQARTNHNLYNLRDRSVSNSCLKCRSPNNSR